MRFPYEIRTPSYLFGVLRNHYPPEIAESVRGMKLCKDRKGGVFDVPDAVKDQVLAVR